MAETELCRWRRVDWSVSESVAVDFEDRGVSEVET